MVETDHEDLVGGGMRGESDEHFDTDEDDEDLDEDADLSFEETGSGTSCANFGGRWKQINGHGCVRTNTMHNRLKFWGLNVNGNCEVSAHCGGYANHHHVPIQGNQFTIWGRTGTMCDENIIEFDNGDVWVRSDCTGNWLPGECTPRTSKMSCGNAEADEKAEAAEKAEREQKAAEANEKAA